MPTTHHEASQVEILRSWKTIEVGGRLATRAFVGRKDDVVEFEQLVELIGSVWQVVWRDGQEFVLYETS